MAKREEITAEFIAVSRTTGQRYTIQQWQISTSSVSSTGTTWAKGATHFTLSNGDPVTRLKDGSFKIVMTDDIAFVLEP